jgi:hypothetical protein
VDDDHPESDDDLVPPPSPTADVQASKVDRPTIIVREQNTI